MYPRALEKVCFSVIQAEVRQVFPRRYEMAAGHTVRSPQCILSALHRHELALLVWRNDGFVGLGQTEADAL